eukprot:1177184-Rhodomonas_salina.1
MTATTTTRQQQQDNNYDNNFNNNNNNTKKTTTCTRRRNRTLYLISSRASRIASPSPSLATLALHPASTLPASPLS